MTDVHVLYPRKRKKGGGVPPNPGRCHRVARSPLGYRANLNSGNKGTPVFLALRRDLGALSDPLRRSRAPRPSHCPSGSET